MTIELDMVEELLKGVALVRGQQYANDLRKIIKVIQQRALTYRVATEEERIEHKLSKGTWLLGPSGFAAYVAGSDTDKLVEELNSLNDLRNELVNKLVEINRIISK